MAAESLSLWWPVSAWVSSGTAWFVFFNVIVGVVGILSWGQQGGDDATLSRRRRLTRSASSMVIDRLRSFNSLSFFSFHSAADYGGVTAQPTSELHHVQLQEYYTSQEEVEAEEIRQAISMVEPGRTVLVGMVEPGRTLLLGESRTATMAPASAPAATTAAVRAGAAEVSTTGSEEAAPTESPEEMAVSLESDESCAVVLQPPAASATAVEAAATVEGPRKMALAGVPEFADQRRACAEVEEKAEVNARAERFIRQFREDLKLERLKSILNYSRCGGAATAR